MKNAEFRMQNVKKRHLAGRLGDRVLCGAAMRKATPFNRKERKERKEKTEPFFKQRFLFAFFAFFAVPFGLFWADACSGEEAGQPFVRLYDTGTPSSDPLPVEAVAAMAGWVQVPAADMTHKFKGNVAFGNDRLMVVLRAKGCWATVYPIGRHGAKGGSDLVPMVKANDGAVEHATVFRILENTSGAVAVEVTFTGPATATFRLVVGQPYVEVRPGAGTAELWVWADSRLIVVPDFFGDDMVFTPDGYELGLFRLPAENFVLGLGGRGDRMTMCVWQDRTADARAMLWERSSRFAGWKIDCIEGKSIWVAFLEGEGLCHERSVPAKDAGKTLDWKPPFPAKWRADSIRDNGFAESVTFELPLSAGWAMPALKAGKHVIYPLDRTRATPLTEFTPVDILRNTLGVGPCQYILETEGLATADNPTPDQVMTWVEKQLKKKGGKDAADDIRERLKAMAALAGRTEARIRRYADFAAEMRELLAGDNSEAGLKLKATADALAQAAAAGLAATEPPGRVAKLADTVAGLIGKDTAVADLAAPAADLRSIGAAQDRALAKSRMAVRWLNCQAQTSEIYKRTDAFLQSK
jgi:hypothetical protein